MEPPAMTSDDANPAFGRARSEIEPLDIDAYLGMARAHSATDDSRKWVEDLEDIIRVAWRLMTEEQKQAFRGDPEILAISEAADFADDQQAGF
jgi:hypothetical protein